MNWLYYTMIFGSLPIAIRFVVSISASSEQIPLFSLADFAFWGIMLNTAAIANATSQKKASPDLIGGIVTAALTHIVLLVAVYCIALFPAVSQIVVWCVAVPIFASSFFLSYLTTDREFLLSVQKTFEMATKRERLHPLMKAYLKTIEDRIARGENPAEGEGMVEFFDSHGLEIDFAAKKIRKKKRDVKPPD